MQHTKATFENNLSGIACEMFDLLDWLQTSAKEGLAT